MEASIDFLPRTAWMSLIAYHTVVLLLCTVTKMRTHAKGKHAHPPLSASAQQTT